MPQLNIQIPRQFTSNAAGFVRSVQRFASTTDQFAATSPRVSIQHLKMLSGHTHNLGPRIRRLTRLSRDIESMLSQSIAKMGISLGPELTALLRGASVVGGIAGIMASVAVGGVLGIGFLGYQFGKWLWDTMMKVGDSIVKDYLTTTATRMSVGGLRAYRAVFGTVLPDDPALITNVMRASGDLMSAQMAALRALGVKQYKDNADTIVAATIAAAKFMKSQAPGTELIAAQKMGYLNVFSVEKLMALKELSTTKLARLTELYEKNKDKLDISERAQEALMSFVMTVSSTWAKLQKIFAETLGDPRITEALKSISQSVVSIINTVMHLPIMKDLIENIARLVREFAAWLKSEDAKNLMNLIAETVKSVAEAFIEGVKLLASLQDILRKLLGMQTQVPGTQMRQLAPIARYPGRARFTKRVGIARPEGAPYIAPSIKRFPGRARFDKRIGVARPEGAPKIVPYTRGRGGPGGAPGVAGGRYEPPALKTPKSPAEAPESVEDAVKGGYRRPGGEGIVDRSRFRKELEENPALREKVLRIAANEQGANPEGTTAVIESMMNRAAVRGTTLEKQARWYESEHGYYQQGTMGRGMNRSVVERSLDRALGGSNVSRGATDNSSGNLAAREKRGGEFTHTKDINGESFFTRNSEDRKRQERLQIRPADPSKMESYTIQDIQRALRSGTQSPLATAEGGDVRQSQGEVAGIRRGALKPELANQLQYAASMTGVRVDVTSGGQPEAGPHRTGSHRHDLGGAADIDLYDARTGKKLDMRNPEDAARMEDFAAHAVHAGATGVGAGLGYMGPSKMHIGGGSETSWGGAPWIERARRRGMSQGQMNPAQVNKELENIAASRKRTQQEPEPQRKGGVFINQPFPRGQTSVEQFNEILNKRFEKETSTQENKPQMEDKPKEEEKAPEKTEVDNRSDVDIKEEVE